MSDPGYDFFATGRPQPPPGGPAVPEPPVAPPLAPPAGPPVTGPQPAYGAPAPTRTFQMPNGTQVNQFGTPIGEVAAPTGPYAAPGVAAVPTAAPGMVTTWGGPPLATSHRATPETAADTGVPRNVRAVAILAVFFGLLGLWVTVTGFSAYSEVSARLDSLGANKAMASGLLTAALVVLLLVAAATALWLTGGIATLTGQRWGGWVLVVAYSLYLLSALYQFGQGSFSIIQVLLVLTALVLLLVMVTGEGRAWVTGKR